MISSKAKEKVISHHYSFRRDVFTGVPFAFMQIVTRPIDSLIPYENNPRKNDKAVDAVAASIREFGFKVPLVIDKNNIIVCGHTRLKAAEKLGLKEIPCVIADDLSEEQIKAFRLADNKVAEQATWDLDKLKVELEGLTIDMSEFSFDIPEEREDIGYYGDERERTFESVNLNDFDPERAAGFYQMPILKATKHIPKDLISFNYVLNTDAFEKGVHFYIDDYQFERIWNNPHVYMDRLKKFDCCLTPDFSLYTDMPVAMQVWNVYRSRLIGQIMQDYGIVVIPTLSWCRKDSFKFCFDGIEPGGVVSVSTIGVKEDPEATQLWVAVMDEAMKRLKPSHVVVYGGDIGYEFKCGASYIANHNAEKISGKSEV